MMRAILSSVAVLGICVGLAAAADKNADKNKNGHKATISKVDQKNHTVTLKMKDKDGKETERTFKLTEEVRYVDSNGKVAAADIFQNGDDVLVVEAEGKLKELHHAKKGSGGTDKK